MKDKIYPFILIALLLFAIGCEQVQDIEYKIPFENEGTVVYGFLSDVDTSIVQVYKTQSVLDENPDFTIDQAKVNIYENDSLIENFTLEGTSIFKYYYPHQQSSRYRIEVVKNEETISSALFGLDLSVGIDNVEYTYSQDSSKIDFSFHFTDIVDATYYSYSIRKYSAGELILEQGENREERYLNIFSDEEFVNSTKEIAILNEDLQEFRFDENFNFIGVADIDSIEINLFVLSEEFYLRRESELENNESEIGRTNSTNEAIWSNIINGYGYAGGVTRQSISITF